MKKLLLLSVLFVGIFTAVHAQGIKILPTNLEVKSWPDGWHKFELQGAIFDVEILGGRYTQGVVKWLDGTTYSGRLSGAYVSGKGTYTWANGMRYEGSFKKGKRHGKGSLILITGQNGAGSGRMIGRTVKEKYLIIKVTLRSKEFGKMINE